MLMPLNLSVGLTMKRGLRNYGSVGASCHVEVELECSLLQGDLDGFHRHARNAFLSCRQAVYEELARHQDSEAGLPTGNSFGGDGHHGPTNHRRSRNGRAEARRATANQIGALEALARRQQIDLPSFLSERFRVAAADDLSLPQASQLIDELQSKMPVPGEQPA
jgi:hypothetical protein